MKPDNASSISIVTVVKDDLLGLRQTAESIIHQTYNPAEWIILDGESGPEMTEFLESLSKFPYVHVSTAPPNGIYNAMNRATLTASGEWLWFINAGDVLMNEEVIEILRTNIPKSSNIGIIATPVIQSTPSGFFYSFTKPDLQRNANNFVANFHHQGCLIKRNEFIQTGGYDEGLKLAADGKLLDSIVDRSQVMILDSPLVVFQLGGRSWKDLRKTLEEIDTYRISHQTHFRRNFIVFKNSLRALVLPIKPGVLIKKYLEYRQQAMFDKNPWGIVSEGADTRLEKKPRFEKLLNVGQTSHER
jgi:glycosyltransferase involved in cell wall biosynthesis